MNNLKYSNGSTTYVESLEKKIAELEKQIVAIDMNNEPVAWIEPITESVMKDYDYQNNLFANETGDWIPLYTHPAELTDEEIIKVYEDMLGVASAKGSAIDFARAILRKAQEK